MLKRLFVLVLCCSVLFIATASLAVMMQPAAELDLSYRLVANGFSQPLGLVTTGVQGDERLFILEKQGPIKIMYPDGTVLAEPFLDLTGMVATNSERGVLGLAFHPEFAENGYFYVHYSRRVDNESVENRNGDSVFSRFRVMTNNPNQADPTSESIVLVVDQDFQNHNGGDMVFGPHGYLYIALGDGGSGGDPNNRAQSLDSLLGSVLRILPEPYPDDLVLPAVEPAKCGRSEEPRRYYIPADNPFYDVNGANGCSEIWAYGLRNPWRISFDRETGDLYIADVGQNAWEEVNFQPAASTGGENYGWRCFEGLHEFNTANCPDPATFVEPFFEYDHDTGRSITGGYVYRGEQYARMMGHYIFADFSTGRVWSAINEGVWDVVEESDTNYNVSAFGEGAEGELYLINFGGGIYQVEDAYGLQVDVAAPDFVVDDTPFVYTFSLENVGAQPLTNVALTMTLSAGATYVSGGTLAGDAVSWQIPTLEAEGTTAVSLTLTTTQRIDALTYSWDTAETPPVDSTVMITTYHFAQLFGNYIPLVNQE